MSFQIVLDFGTAQEAMEVLEYVGDSDAPVMLEKASGSYVEVDGVRFALWSQYGQAADALAAIQ